MSVTVPYDADKDICFGTVDSEGWIPLTQGKFVILMPSDAHKPGIHLDNETSKVVRKAVFKIKLQQ